MSNIILLIQQKALYTVNPGKLFSHLKFTWSPIFAVADPFPIRYIQGRKFSRFQFSRFGVTANYSHSKNFWIYGRKHWQFATTLVYKPVVQGSWINEQYLSSKRFIGASGSEPLRCHFNGDVVCLSVCLSVWMVRHVVCAHARFPRA